MYANLRVSTADGAVHYAAAVEIDADGAVNVFLDANDGEGDEAIPAGVVKLTGAATITADF